MRDAAREHELERAHGRQLLDQRRLERLKRDAILVGQHDVSQGAHAMPQGILRRARLALGASSARATARRSCDWLRRGHCSRERPRQARRRHSDMAGFL